VREKILQDLAPVPGRLASSLRIVLATVMSLILLLVWQMPFASLALYFVFLVARESPALSLRSGLVSWCAVSSAVALEMLIVIATDNEPAARVLSVAAVGFLAGMITLGSNFPPLGGSYGLIFCTLIAFWENPAPADALVKNSLWLLASFSLALGCSIAVEYALVSPRQAEKLQEQRRVRYEALAAMFGAFARGAPREEIAAATVRVQRLAAAGQTGMQALYNAVVERNLDRGSLPIGSRVRITMLAQLMDDAAAFGTHQDTAVSDSIRERCARIAEQCSQMMAAPVNDEPIETHLRPEAGSLSLLDHVEETLRTIRNMPVVTGANEDKELVSLPASKVSFWVAGAWTNRNTVAFALKVSLCATICYVVYHAVDWPGIATAVTTVFVSAVGTSGAINQRITFRFIGSLIGGFLAIGATVFVFPYIDSITPLVAVIAAVAFVSAWIAGGRQFSYVGLQIAFSFYIVAFEGFSAPIALSPPRDRLVGILLALAVMWFVFDQWWPVRTVTAMRQAFASILHQEAELLRIAETTPDHEARLRKADEMRDHVGKTMAGLRTMNDAVRYEYGANRAEYQRSGEIIVTAALTSVAMFWNQLTVLHRPRDRDFLEDKDLALMRNRVADQVEAMAGAVVQKNSFERVETATIMDACVIASPRYGDYAHNTTARFEELQALVADLNAQPV
jgi:multidrug resistance protein MdtO